MKKIEKNKSGATGVSLSKYLAQAGIASRRNVIELIKTGFVTVNGKIISEPGYKLQPEDKVLFKNKPVKVQEKIYILLNKPKGYVTTVSDEKNRKTVMDLVGGIKVRLYPIGRLDRDTTGLLILTNDGILAQKMSHPRYNIPKTYTVVVDRLVSKEDIDKIKTGLHLFDGFIKVDEVHYMPESRRNHIKVVLHSGKNRIVRRIFESLEYEVKRLDRIGYAGLGKRGLDIGQWRHLTSDEVTQLYKKPKSAKRVVAKKVIKK